MNRIWKKEFRIFQQISQAYSKFNIKHSNNGFTLIEAVVSAAVFAFVVSSVIGVYLAVTNIDAKTRAERGVQENARFVMDFLGKEIRNGTISYSDYAGGVIQANAAGYAPDLRIRNQANESETFSCNGTDLVLTKSSGATLLNSPKVKVTKCAFYVNPLTSPFASGVGAPEEQPFVTVVLQLTGNYGGRVVDSNVIDLESTFAVRDYSGRN